MAAVKLWLLVGTGLAVLASAVWLLMAEPSSSGAPTAMPRATDASVRPSATDVAPRSARDARDAASPERIPTTPATSESADPAGSAPVADGGVAPGKQLPVLAVMEVRNLAQDAYRARAYQAAMEHAMAALELEPTDGQSHRLIALSACELKQRDVAQRHAEALDTRRFEQVQRQCAARGVSLRHPFKPTPGLDEGEDEGEGRSEGEGEGDDSGAAATER